MAMTFQGLVLFLLIGLIAGWISGLITKGSGFGPGGNMVVGIIGAFLGGFLFRLLGIVAYGLLGQVVFAVIGALVFLYLLRFIEK
ncbi:MAG TPA: GlsB/YeaQ/YmgE family stress response membrane protein [Opitutaceae bacterium]|nr:GlsB/YeaQ/YmgE family stress response membrane protein [Opitutaceae bacterium]